MSTRASLCPPFCPVAAGGFGGGSLVGSALLEELGFEVGDPRAEEAVGGAGSFEAFLEFAVFGGELPDGGLERGVLGDKALDGFAGDYLVEVANLAHELCDAFPLDEDLLLGSGEFGFGVERSFAPGGLDTVVVGFS